QRRSGCVRAGRRAHLASILALLGFASCGPDIALGPSRTTGATPDAGAGPPALPPPPPPPPPIVLGIYPLQDTAPVRGVSRFWATIPVNWVVQEEAGGSITSDGLYTAPQTIGTFHIIATDRSDPTNTLTATIAVVSHGFVPAGYMIVPRARHTATRLRD